MYINVWRHVADLASDLTKSLCFEKEPWILGTIVSICAPTPLLHELVISWLLLSKGGGERRVYSFSDTDINQILDSDFQEWFYCIAYGKKDLHEFILNRQWFLIRRNFQWNNIWLFLLKNETYSVVLFELWCKQTYLILSIKKF